MPITLRPLPDSPEIVISDSADFAALTDDERTAYHEHWDVDSNSVFLVHLSNTPLDPWLDLLGAVIDNSHAPPRPSLELEVLESLFLRAFCPSADVFPKEIGSFFVAPSRLEEALTALVDAGLDLSLPDGITTSNAHAILLSRINSVLSSGFQLLVLRSGDLLPTVPVPAGAGATKWPSKVQLGALIQPANGGLAPAADLLGLLGFRLHYSDREDPTAQFMIVSNAFVAPQLVGPMAAVGDDAKPWILAERVVATAWPPALQELPRSYLSALGDVADRLTYESADTARQVISKRFNTVTMHLPATTQFVSGAPAPQAFQLAVGLADNLLDVTDNSSLAALFALEANLVSKVGLLDAHSARNKSAQERCALLLAHKDAADEAADAVPSVDAPAVSVTSAVTGVALRYTRELGVFLLSNEVTGPAVLIPGRVDKEGNAMYDEAGSGLLALLGKLGGSHVNQLRVLFGRRNAFVVQALLSQFHHPDPLFKLIADARPHISKYLSMSIVTEDDGSVKPHDYTFELDDQFVKDILAGKWDQDYHKHLLVRLYAHRSRSLAPKAVPKKEQWLTATACTTGKLAARLFGALAFPRHDAMGFSELIDTVVAYIAAAPAGVDHTVAGVKIVDSALRFASRRWSLWIKSPPGSKPPSSFLEADDHCFELITDAQKAQDDLFALSNAYPGIVASLARQNPAATTASSSASSSGGSPGGGGGGGSPAKPPSAKKQKSSSGSSSASRSAPSSNSAASSASASSSSRQTGPSDKPTIAPKSLADKCTWNGRQLKFERHYFDAQTKSYVALTDDILDIGAFCQATGTDFNAYCWPYVATMYLQSKANNNHPQHCKNLAAARCKHFGLTGHTEAPTGKHATPPSIEELSKYFRRG